MSFTLKIISGKAEGKSFTFTKKRVTIGRLPENDLVLYDTGVSRKHCEIVNFKPGKYGVQDLGSANGTRVNDLAAKKATLKDGDIIQIGPVAFEFTADDIEKREVPEDAQRYRESPSGMLPEGTRARQHMEQVSTVALEPGQVRGLKELRAEVAARRRQVAEPEPAATPASPPASQPPAAPAAAPIKGGGPRLTLGRAGARGKPPPPPVEEPVLEERQLTQRRAGLTAWRLAWMRLGRKRRPVVAAAAGALALGLLLVVVYLAMRGPSGLGPDHSAKIFELTAESGSRSYGFGKVDVTCRDKVNFSFNYSGGLAVLRYAAGGIDSPNEVVIYVNGKRADAAPLAATWITDLRVKLPREHLKPHAPNIITFDNTRNPPDSDRWGVAQIEVIQKALPAPQPGRARELFLLGQNAHKSYLVDPANLSRALEYYNDALLFLEALDPAPPDYQAIAMALKEAEEQLDKIVKDKNFEAYSAWRRKDFDKARQAYMEILQFLPNVEDVRRQEVINRLRELGSQ